ncbi:MAG: signal peptide peptidase SppA [Candidatus Marinimicrobia bacterium]|nr:signal peptide peptidase SppA [Candidatus Neomarinimicrobiota bacterium]
MFRIVIMVLFGANLLFGQIQFTLPSVAAVDDPLAVKYNPAGLAFNEHTETMMFGHFDGSSFTKDFAYYSQNKATGFGYQWDVVSAKNIWSFGQGIKINESHAIGFSYSYDDSKWGEGRFDVAWMHRPLPLLAVGASLQNAWSGMDEFVKLNSGVAFQNRNGRWGAGFEFGVVRDDSGSELDYVTSQAVSFFVEPVEGLRVNAFADLNNTSSVGISLSFLMPDFGVESHGVSDKMNSQTIGFRTTVNPYRSVFDKKPVKKDEKTYIRIKLDGLLIEEPEVKKPNIPFKIDLNIPFIGESVVYGKQLKKFIDQIQEYTDDPDIHGMVIDLGHFRGGFSKISEARLAFQRFHDAGKQIIVYSKFGLSNPTTYLLSMADEIYIHEMAGVDLRGLAMEVTFFRGLLDTLSIVPEVWRVSPFKTAADPFLQDKMSEAMRTNYSQLLQSVYDQFVAGIAAGKDWSEEQTIEVINSGPYMLLEDAIAAELITGSMYPDEFDDYIKDLNDGKITIIKPKKRKDVSPYQYAWRDDKVKNKIAVIYAVGGIVSGKSKPGPSGSKNMGDETIAGAIKAAREDKSIKAIVLRIDSGGGSALASDIMWREVLKATETDSANIKPFIASMSDVAASGGYYIACQADSIIAYPSTITGSIGVIGMRLNFSQLKERFGIHAEGIKMGDHADFGSGSRLATDEEDEMILASINDVYIKFKERVLKGRDALDDIERLDSLALGRVWTGTDAKEYGLIDEVGGYYDAIELAKHAAGITGDVEIVELPNYQSKMDFKKLIGGDASIDLVSMQVLESIKVMDIIPILEGGEIQMIMPVKIDIK